MHISDANGNPGTVIQVVAQSNIGIPSLITFSLIAIIAICSLIGFVWVYRAIKSNRASNLNEDQSTSTSIHVVEANQYTPTPCRKRSYQGLEKDLRQTAITSKENGKWQRSISVQDHHERYKCYKQSNSFPSSNIQQPYVNHKATSVKCSKTNISDSKKSISCQHCENSVTCLSSCEDDTSVHFINENAPHAYSHSTKYIDNVTTENNNELEMDNISNCMSNDSCKIANNNKKVIFLKNHKSNISQTSKIRNILDESGANGRKRLISLQTSFEDEPSESSRCSSCECVVTEVTKLGNGKIKKTIYKYNIERPPAKERLYSI